MGFTRLSVILKYTSTLLAIHHFLQQLRPVVMSLPDWVQLFRNAFSVAKTLAPSESALFKVHFPNSRLPLPAIDFLVAATQLPAIYFFGSNGINSFVSSYADVRKYKRLLLEVDRFRFEDMDSQDGVGPEIVSATLRHALTVELAQARRLFKIGIAQFFITVAFTYLSLNTLQFRFPGHPMSVINAVICMLIGLSYVLYNLLLSILGKYRIASRSRKLKKRLRHSSNGNSLDEMLNLMYRASFGENLMEALVALTANAESGEETLTLRYKEKDVTDYEAVVEADLETIAAAYKSLPATANSGSKRKSRAKSSTDSASDPVPSTLLHSLDAHIRSQYRSAGLSSAFWLINAVAGYGYLMPVLAFYLPHEKQAQGTVLGAVLKLAMFAHPSAIADWWGNMAGDVAWTLEPLLVMAAPTIMKTVQQMQASSGRHTHKTKSD